MRASTSEVDRTSGRSDADPPPQSLRRGNDVVRTRERARVAGQRVAHPIDESGHAAQHLRETALLAAEAHEHRAVVHDRSVRHVAAEDLAEPVLVRASHVGLRRLVLELVAVELRPPHRLLLLHDRQRFPRDRVMGPLLQEQDRPRGARASLGDQGELGRIDEAGVLGAVDEPGQISIVTVGPARRLLGHRCEPVQPRDGLASRVEDHVIRAAGEPEHGIVLRGRHREAVHTDHVVVEPDDVVRRDIRHDASPELGPEAGDEIDAAHRRPGRAKRRDRVDEGRLVPVAAQIELEVGVRSRAESEDPALRDAHGPDDASSGAVPSTMSRARATWRRLRLPRLELGDPQLTSLKSAARAAIVIPAVFAVADKVIQEPQTALFAAFGSFAMLVLVDFTGPSRSRFVAYVVLAFVGAANIVVGTLCSRNAWLAAGAMAVVGFVILFSGVINGYFAAGATSAILTFVLPVTIAAPVSALPARLEGWALAAGAGICAHMLLWPARPPAALRSDAARACRSLADLADPSVPREPSAAAARDAVAGLRRRFLATPHRPAGPTGPTAALASLVDELDWLLSFLVPKAGSRELCKDENGEAMAATASVLRAGAGSLEGQDELPDLQQLDEAREAVARALVRRVRELPSVPDADALLATLDPAFRARASSYSARQVAGYALLARGAAATGFDDLDVAGPDRSARPARAAVQATEHLAVEHAGARSVWLQNSVRGAVGLAVAVFVAQRAGLQHAFWVVLGTLSVLRSNALSTGWSILSALAGTAAGIVVGAALVIAIGTHEPVLWGVLPVAIMLAAYAPRAVSCAAGQAGFTVALFVLF